MKSIFISKEGCDVFPHLSVHEVVKEDETTYYTLGDRFPKEWAGGELKDTIIDKYKGMCYKSAYKALFEIDNGETYLNWNEFRRFGYYKDGNKTNRFTKEEYEKFEKYSDDNKLNINKYD
jgi:hypothetical protein